MKSHRRILPVLGALAALWHPLLPLACSLYGHSLPLTVQLPRTPDHWQAAFPELRYRIVYPIPDRDSFEELIVEQGTPLAIELSKILYLPVLAYPIISAESLQLPPAGGIYPLDCNTQSSAITLSWESGAAAEVLYRLWIHGVNCSTINVPRLRVEMVERCEGDPWSLDLSLICSQLANRDLRVTDIHLAPCRDLLLESSPGQWFLESPFRTPVEAAEGYLRLERVPLGPHLLFNGASGSCFFLSVDQSTVLLSLR
jgi:hypothetical protein